MSSIIRRLRDSSANGQVLPLFAFGLVVLFLFAALVLDVGQSLFDKRKQQDAADAAALAGARWVTDSGCFTAPSNGNCPNAVQAAMAIATKHGYAPSQVQINIPPTNASRFAGARGHIQVVINSTRPSWFAGVAGLTSFNVSALAVAANTTGYSLPYSFLALNPSCASGSNSTVTGNGTVTVGGAIQVNTTGCNQGAFKVGGGGTNTVSVTSAGGCNVTGTAVTTGGSAVSCPGPPTQGAPFIPDPLSDLEVDLTTLAAAPAVQVLAPVGQTMPNNSFCPGTSNAGSVTSPKKCQLGMVGPSSTTVTTLLLSPGIYYGGLDVQYPPTGKTLNVYLLPGIYAFAGGGFSPSGNGNGIFNLRTVVSAGDLSFGGGVLLYNTDHPLCATTGAGCIGAVSVTGGAGSLQLKPYQFDPYKNLLLYQDRNASNQPAISITGQGTFDVSGTIYAPKANVKVAGSGSGVSAQIIAYTFDVTGGGALNVTYNADGVYKLNGLGLVQ